MVHHGFVPDSFVIGVIIPLVKDKQYWLCDIDNYRGITLSPVLQNCLNIVSLTNTSTRCLIIFNFVLRRNSSDSHSIFVLRQVAEFCVTHGSNVYMAALDATKAFDRVHHLKLFNVLTDRKFHFFIIKVIVNCCSKLFTSVRWNGVFF